MGLSGMNFWHLLILLLVVAMVFGTKKLRGLGSDLGEAVKGFRSAMKEEPKAEEQPAPPTAEQTAKAEPPRLEGRPMAAGERETVDHKQA
mgnify:FL=1|jgi:sec-independent protein translocase protein TatA